IGSFFNQFKSKLLPMFSKVFFMALIFILFSLSIVKGQQNYTWFSPLEDKQVEGRIDNHKLTAFNRLPDELENQVRKPVWQLGENSAGLYIDFQTSASEIKVQYQVAGALNMPHMPTTGVSGLDLYAYDNTSKDWKWAYGNY